VALGVAGGYFLGRTKKMKLALMLAGMAAGRQVGGPGELLKGGTKLLAGRPELARLTDEVRGRLLEAGKAAAVAAATRQVEALTDRVGKRVEALGDVGAGGRRRAEKLTEDLTAEKSAPDERAEDEYAEEPAETEPADVREEREEPAARRSTRTSAAKSPRGRGNGRSGSATATVRRTAPGAAGAAGRAAAGRKPRTRRGEGDG
jgi:hypothetical protein